MCFVMKIPVGGIDHQPELDLVKSSGRPDGLTFREEERAGGRDAGDFDACCLRLFYSHGLAVVFG